MNKKELIRKKNMGKKCVIDQDNLDYAKEEDQMFLVDLLKKIGDDIVQFDIPFGTFESCSIGIYDASIELKFTNVDINNVEIISKEFNKFCKTQIWCIVDAYGENTVTLHNKTSPIEYMHWEFDEDIIDNEGDVIRTLFCTNFDIFSENFYISINLTDNYPKGS